MVNRIGQLGKPSGPRRINEIHAMCFVCVLSSEPALGYTGHVSSQQGVREAVLCGSYELASQGL